MLNIVDYFKIVGSSFFLFLILLLFDLNPFLAIIFSIAICTSLRLIIISLETQDHAEEPIEQSEKNHLVSTNNFSYVNQLEIDNLMTDFEYDFYLKFSTLEKYYKIIPQFQLSNAIGKEGKHYRIDFAIYSFNFKQLLLLIELNDSTHREKDRIQRDKIVQLLCEKYNIKLLTFYSNMPNDSQYVINRIIQKINNN